MWINIMTIITRNTPLFSYCTYARVREGRPRKGQTDTPRVIVKIVKIANYRDLDAHYS